MNPPPSPSAAAEQNLAVIRTLMERAAIYRRALGPIMVTVGALGMGAGVVGTVLRVESSRAFFLFWVGVAAVAVTTAFLLSRRQARRQGEPFWSTPTQQVAQALTVPLLVGVVTSAFSSDMPRQGPVYCVMLWLLCYGLALHAAGFATPAGLRYLGWAMVLSGFAVFRFGMLDTTWGAARAHLAMGLTFGLLQLLAGLYLLATDRRTPAP